MKGLKVSLESSYAPDTGAKNGLLKAELKTNPATLTIDTVCALTNMPCAVHKAHCAPWQQPQDLNLGGPLVNTSAVVGHAGWLAGLQVHSCGKDLTLILTVKMTNFFLHEYFLPGRLRHEQGEACEKQLCAWLRHFRLRPPLKRQRRIHFRGFDLSEGGDYRIWSSLNLWKYNVQLCIFEGQIRPWNWGESWVHSFQVTFLFLLNCT